MSSPERELFERFLGPTRIASRDDLDALVQQVHGASATDTFVRVCVFTYIVDPIHAPLQALIDFVSTQPTIAVLMRKLTIEGHEDPQRPYICLDDLISILHHASLIDELELVGLRWRHTEFHRRPVQRACIRELTLDRIVVDAGGSPLAALTLAPVWARVRISELEHKSSYANVVLFEPPLVDRLYIRLGPNSLFAGLHCSLFGRVHHLILENISGIHHAVVASIFKATYRHVVTVDISFRYGSFEEKQWDLSGLHLSQSLCCLSVELHVWLPDEDAPDDTTHTLLLRNAHLRAVALFVSHTPKGCRVFGLRVLFPSVPTPCHLSPVLCALDWKRVATRIEAVQTIDFIGCRVITNGSPAMSSMYHTMSLLSTLARDVFKSFRSSLLVPQSGSIMFARHQVSQQELSTYM